MDLRTLRRLSTLPNHFREIRRVRLDGPHLALLVGQNRFRIPYAKARGLRHFLRFEEGIFAILKALCALRPGPFIDIGANIGQTLLKIKAIDLDIEYVGFEPSPACCAYLDVLIQRNQLRNCIILPVGAGDKQSILRLYYNHSTDAAATTVSGFWTGGNSKTQTRSILVERADVLIEQVVDTVGIVKIDVEGGELEALAGLASVITKHSPPILMEILPASCDLDSHNPDSAHSVRLRLDRLSKLTGLFDRLELQPYRLMPDGTLLETREFDSKKYAPEFVNYLLVSRDSSLDLDKLSARFRREIQAA